MTLLGGLPSLHVNRPLDVKMLSKRNDVSSQSTLSVLIMNRNNEQMLLMYFRFACSRDIFRCNQLLYGTGPFWKYSRSLSKELDLLLILNTKHRTFHKTNEVCSVRRRRTVTTRRLNQLNQGLPNEASTLSYEFLIISLVGRN